VGSERSAAHLHYLDRGDAIASITDLCPAADWVERETREYFAIEFTGRKTTRSLMIRDGDPIGINLHKEAVK
jgi:NADH:ubiquinone oxidoreductase subunit C